MGLEAGLHNASDGPQRPPGLPCRGAGAQLHPGRRAARGLPIAPEPAPPRARGAARPPLLTRTTRSVAPTEAGERLLGSLGPAFDQIDSALAAISEFRGKPSG